MTRQARQHDTSHPQKESAAERWRKVFGFPSDLPSFGKYVAFISPSKKLKLVFEPGIECAMMRYQFQFRLVDSRLSVLQSFGGLVSPMQHAWWSRDSRLVAIAVEGPNGGLLVYEVKGQRYSLLRFNAYQETAMVTSRSVRIGVDRQEFEAVFGTEFQPPRDTRFPLSSLTWFPAPEKGAWKLNVAFRRAPRAKWEPAPSKAMREYAKKNGITLLC